MNVLILGMMWEGQAPGALCRALRRAGHQTIHWPLRAKLREHNGDWVRVQNQLRQLDFRPHLVLVFNVFEAPDREWPAWLKATFGCPVGFYSFDDPLKFDELIRPDDGTARWVLGCDHVFTCTWSTTYDYRQAGVPATWCPPATDPEYHRPMPPSGAPCDLSLFCTAAYRRKDFPEVILDRGQALDELQRLHRDRRLIVRLHGPDRLKDHWPHIHAGLVDWVDLAAVNAASKVCLDSHVRPDGTGYLNERVCQIAGSGGGVLLCDAVPGLEEVFRPGVEAVHYRDHAEGLWLAQEWAREKWTAERARMSAAARTRALAWSYDAMAHQIVTTLTRGPVERGPWDLSPRA